MEKLLKIAKPFVGSLKEKVPSRPILKCALVTPEYIIATDTHILIRIEHDNLVMKSYLHKFVDTYRYGMSPEQYPDVERLFPSSNAVVEEINVLEWLQAHEAGLFAAKTHRNNKIILGFNKLSVEANKALKDKQDQVEFTHILDSGTFIEKVAYDCKYMIMVLKAFKALKENTVTLYFYGKNRPMLFSGEKADVLLMPIRIEGRK